MTNTAAPAAWTFRKVTDENTTCDVCGRSDLRSTTLFTNEAGDQLYAGSECARKVTGWTTAMVRQAVETAARAEQAARHAAERVQTQADHAAILEHFGVADILEVPRAARKAFLASR